MRSVVTHRRGHIDADGCAGRAHTQGGQQEIGARATADVQDNFTGPQWGDGVRIADAGEPRRDIVGEARERVGVVPSDGAA